MTTVQLRLHTEQNNIEKLKVEKLKKITKKYIHVKNKKHSILNSEKIKYKN